MIVKEASLVTVVHQLEHIQINTTNLYVHIIVSTRAKFVQTFDKFNNVIISEQKKP